ncbi:hypothetical protein BOX15_Mlig000459g1 [Macrostomum lignano]|uniref:K Homology domain-containing protein n=2 Tax=Macrostomum lignano TaxID=282301 RepID=A0A267FF01_9PLAT|nr:hypothetical protein BOX15_Mlig000459g1 [Macrostomum lignano]
MDSDNNSVHKSSVDADNVQLKVLVPSIAAGAIIGKGGEAITAVQTETGAKVKMSKSNDFYPGTTERVCLIQGSLDSVKTVCFYVMEKTLEKPDPNPKLAGDGKLNVERHKQMKILVPNSTAGMIIGKQGAYIKEIMDGTGAYVQISQKPKEQALAERCVTVAGETQQARAAMSLILEKIASDPQSASCPNISYSSMSGPVASAYPTGSPYALSSGASGTGLGAGGAAGAAGGGLREPQSPAGAAAAAAAACPVSFETLRASLRQSGYTEPAVDEIVGAMLILANYGFFSLQTLVAAGPQAQPQPQPPGPVALLSPSPHSSFSLSHGSLAAALAAAAAAGPPPPPPPDTSGADFAMFASGTAPPPLFADAFMADGTDKAAAAAMSGPMVKRELDVPEPLIGALIGPGGRDISQLQTSTQTCIQVSRRVSGPTPLSHSRLVTITGMQPNVLKAERLIQQKISQADQRRQQHRYQ